jgi:hypothetical protein
MINAPALLRDLKRLTATIEADIRERMAANTTLDAALNQEWQAAKNAGRTGAMLHDFKEGNGMDASHPVRTEHELSNAPVAFG